MTRKEQIIHAAKQEEKKVGFAQIVKEAKGVNSAYGIGFLEGAKWADEHSIEVKEVDLEKEINKYISDNFFGSETMGFFAVRTKEEPNDQDIALCAKHFFELGLKNAKGNKI